MLNALDIHVTGIVQGVGFRPFVYRLAKRYLVNGWVLNAVDGVHIHAEGEEQLVDEFIMEMHDNPPAAAKIARIDMKEVPLEGFESFEIRFSEDDEVEQTTLVSPDLATCDDCLAELFDPANRRYRYPFINCTNCGPRFTIIDGLPYDRAQTSMAPFEMCAPCAAEYADPADRRFHAQPDACFDCGPHLRLAMLAGDADGNGADGGKATKDNTATGDATEGSAVASNATGNGAGNEAAESSAATSFSGSGDAPGAREALRGVGSKEVPSADVSWSWGMTREESDTLIAQTVDLLAAGKIVAVKGLGGFHLVCDATNPQALAELRLRKKREGKAFAVMVPDVQAARAWCSVSADEEALLQSPARPIVLLRKLPNADFAEGLADSLAELGVMLPATPLQHLLLHDFEQACGRNMLVFTSGNIHDEPIQTDDDEACRALASIADAILGNDRPIRSRYDDSVVRVLDFGGGETAVQVIRRARGYAPLPLNVGADIVGANAGTSAGADTAAATDATAGAGTTVGAAAAADATAGTGAGVGTGAAAGTGSGAVAITDTGAAVDAAACTDTGATTTPHIFATGPEQKNTFCFLDDQRAFVSQHIGDMENAPTYDAWLEARATFARLFELAPTRIACDMHPEYLTSKWAADQDLPVTQVQHHHAHIVSAMAENNLAGPVLGFAFDGTGYGPDGAIWGGEVLLANLHTYERFANFAYFPLPGGAAAIKHPLRCAYGVLWAFDLLNHPATARVLEALGDEADVCERMIDAGLNTPYTSSVGRLFDAASAILGVCDKALYEGEPAILLSAALETERLSAAKDEPITMEDAYPIDIVKNTATETSTALDTSVVLLDAARAFAALLDDLAAGVPTPTIARRFHDAFVLAIVQMAQLAQAAYGINTVALSGGVFMNRYLTERVVPALADAGFNVAMNRDLPPNDGCISFGQAIVAAS